MQSLSALLSPWENFKYSWLLYSGLEKIELFRLAGWRTELPEVSTIYKVMVPRRQVARRTVRKGRLRPDSCVETAN